MQPHTMTEPPPPCTVGFRQSTLYRSPTPRHTPARPSLWKRQKRDSSEKTTFFHSSSHARRSLHHPSLALTFFFSKAASCRLHDRKTPFRPCIFGWCLGTKSCRVWRSP